MVKIKEYENSLLIIDFYKKIKSRNRYRLLSNDFKFGHVGATILDIMKDIQTKTGKNTFGLIATDLLKENSAVKKRYKVYIEILRRKVSRNYTVFGIEENSFIFVVPKERTPDKEKIFLNYGKIFEETN